MFTCCLYWSPPLWTNICIDPIKNIVFVIMKLSQDRSTQSVRRHAQLQLCPVIIQIDYRSDGSVAQFRSNVSIADSRHVDKVVRKEISVNDPLRYQVSCLLILPAYSAS